MVNQLVACAYCKRARLINDQNCRGCGAALAGVHTASREALPSGYLCSGQNRAYDVTVFGDDIDRYVTGLRR